MMFLVIKMIKYEKNDINLIVNAFLDNKIVIMLTDTVYGIMAMANKENEKRINELKKSDVNKKISVIFPNKDDLFKYLVNIDVEKKNIINEKLPGKYTFIVNLSDFSDFDRSDFGVRVTGNEYLQGVLELVGPVLATSCNISGEEICNNVDDIINVFGDRDIVLVVDKDASSMASTIIDLRDEVKIIRN